MEFQLPSLVSTFRIKRPGYIRTLEANLAEETDQDFRKDSRRLNKIMLTNDEWDLLQDLIPILGPFEEATRYLWGSNYSNEIINKLQTESNENTTNTTNIENLEDVFVWDDDQDNPENSNNEKDANGSQKNVGLNRPMQTTCKPQEF